MTEAQTRLFSAETAWKELNAQWSKRLAHLREEAAKDCDHPAVFQRKYTRDEDNGYGRWWKVDITICGVCGHEERSL